MNTDTSWCKPSEPPPSTAPVNKTSAVRNSLRCVCDTISNTAGSTKSSRIRILRAPAREEYVQYALDEESHHEQWRYQLYEIGHAEGPETHQVRVEDRHQESAHECCQRQPGYDSPLRCRILLHDIKRQRIGRWHASQHDGDDVARLALTGLVHGDHAIFQLDAGSQVPD